MSQNEVFVSFLGDKGTELTKNVTKEHTIENNFKQILGKEIELMKTLQGEIKRFSSLKMNDYYTRLVIRQLQLVETLADNYSEEYENIHNRIIKLFELLAHEKSPKYILPPEI